MLNDTKHFNKFYLEYRIMNCEKLIKEIKKKILTTTQQQVKNKNLNFFPSYKHGKRIIYHSVIGLMII